MNSIMVPQSLIDSTYRAADTYFNNRFPEDYTSMAKNPNYTESGCGIAVTATETPNTMVIADPADNSKALCELEYSSTGLKFIYNKPAMVNNVVSVGVGSTEKLDILEDEITLLENLLTGTT